MYNDNGDVMNLNINKTQDGIKNYPLHKHKHYEIMLYLTGCGYLKTEKNDYSFRPGSIIIVPPGVTHGSTSEDGFVNISIGGDFEHLLHFKTPVCLADNKSGEGTQLASLIYNNRFDNDGYLNKLCDAYLHFLLLNLKVEDNINLEVDKIIRFITERFHDRELDLSELLKSSGYAEDYIRAHFKKITGKTPNGFLTDIRINRACFLIDVYTHTMSLQQIAEQCGYNDYVYFSKKFKVKVGTSPKEYKKTIMDFKTV